MTVVVPFCPADANQALALLEFIGQLGGCQEYNCLLVADAAVDWAKCVDALTLANRAFRDTRIITTETTVTGWPAGANALWLKAAHYCKVAGTDWLWLEPDAIPLKRGWLGSIDKMRKGTRYFGHLYMYREQVKWVMSGIAVYPSDAIDRLGPTIEANPTKAWDVSCAEKVIPQATHTKLIHHFYGEKDLAPTFVENRTSETTRNTFTLDQIPDSAVIFHRNKDGTLIKLLMIKLGMTGHADIVSLRRAGDIVCLLPLLKKISEKEGRPMGLVVHRDFASVLDGVSYVYAVPWDGEWEDPLAAARHFKAHNAQVFGKGLKPDTMNGNFAKMAWAALGHQWKRYLPLEFDRRDLRREQKLSDAVFKTDKPKILVKLNALSSPFAHVSFVRESLEREFSGIAEIVNLDDIKAERVYDLCGLMDRAACLVTTDTVTLWLSHASKCPSIQFTNGTRFGASPPRGNCILRMPYEHVLSRWNEVLSRTRSTLCSHSGDGIVLAYNYWRPTVPDIIRRQDEAWKTWPLLGARLYAFEGKRSSRNIGDYRGVPFVRDMIDGAISSGPENIIAITNNDIKFDPRLGAAIRDSCRRVGCFWAYRVSAPGKRSDNGADVFAFTRCWWATHQHLFPDFLMGYWWWDDIMVRLMMWSGCQEQPRLYYHEPHVGDSPTRRQEVGASHNEHLARQWLLLHEEQAQKPIDQ